MLCQTDSGVCSAGCGDHGVALLFGPAVHHSGHVDVLLHFLQLIPHVLCHRVPKLEPVQEVCDSFPEILLSHEVLQHPYDGGALMKLYIKNAFNVKRVQLQNL